MTRRNFIVASAAVFASAASLQAGIAQTPARSITWMSAARFNFNHLYCLAALENGWFKQEGLEVNLIQGAGTMTAVSQLIAGGALFAQAAAITSCPLIANQDAPLITVGQISYKGFFLLASLPGKPVLTPRDLDGKTIGVMSLAGSTEQLLDAMLAKGGIARERVKRVITGIGPSGVAFLQRGDVDAFFVLPEHRAALSLGGTTLAYLDVDDFAPIPGEALVTSLKAAQDPAQRQVLIGFLRAVRKGLAFYADPANDEAILAIMRKHNPVEASDVARGKETLRLARPYFAPPAGVPHGVPILAEWETSIRAMETIGLIQKPGLPVARYVTDEFARAAS